MASKWLLPTYRKQVDALEPVIRKMKPERARQLSEWMQDMERVAEAYKSLSRSMDDDGSWKEETIANLGEGLSEQDAIILRDFLKEQNAEKSEIYYHLPVDKTDLFHTLGTTAIDVWNDAPRDEDGELIEVAAKD